MRIIVRRGSRKASRRRLGYLAVSMAMAMAMGVVSPLAAAVPTTSYVALGDSYSSGNGLAPLVPGSGACARSRVAYPELGARTLKLRLQFLACSGATTAQVSAQVSRALLTLRGTGLVTLTAGGNDLSFSRLIEACVGLVASATSPSIRYLPQVSSPTICDAAISKASSLLGAHFDATLDEVIPSSSSVALPLSQPSIIEGRLNNLYLKIMRAMGTTTRPWTKGQLVVMQYPTLLSDGARGNCLLSPTPLELPAQSVLNGLYPGFSASTTSALIQINLLLQRETSVVVANLRRQHLTRVGVVVPPPAFASLDCATGSSADLSGIVLAASSSGVATHSLHPTAAGQSLLAAALVARWRLLGH